MRLDTYQVGILSVGALTSVCASWGAGLPSSSQRRKVVGAIVLTTLCLGVIDYSFQPVSETPLAVYLAAGLLCPGLTILVVSMLRRRLGSPIAPIIVGALTWFGAFWLCIRIYFEIEAML